MRERFQPKDGSPCGGFSLDTRVEDEQVLRREALGIVMELTPVQNELIAMMLSAKVDGKLVRRYGQQGSFTYEKQIGKVEEGTGIPMVSIAQTSHEFVGAANLAVPQEDTELLLYFINLRGGTDENYALMAKALAAKRSPFGFDYVTGIPNTGNKVAEYYAALVGKPYYEILIKAGEGSDREFKVNSNLKEKPKAGEVGIELDDLITKAKTKLDARDAYEEGGFKIAGCGVVLDREEGGVQECRKAGLDVFWAVTSTQLFATAFCMNSVPADNYRKIRSNITNCNQAA